MSDSREVVLQKAATQGYGFNVSRNVITKVKPGSPAEVAGLVDGFRILSINGQDTSGMAHTKLVAMVGQAKTELTLVVSEAPSQQSSRMASTSVRASQPRVSVGSLNAFSSNPSSPVTTAAAATTSAPVAEPPTVVASKPPPTAIAPVTQHAESAPAPEATPVAAEGAVDQSGLDLESTGLRHVAMPEEHKPVSAPKEVETPSTSDMGLRPMQPRVPAASAATVAPPAPKVAPARPAPPTTAPARPPPPTTAPSSSASAAPNATPKAAPSNMAGDITRAIKAAARRQSEPQAVPEPSSSGSRVRAQPGLTFSEPFMRNGKQVVTKTDAQVHDCHSCPYLITDAFVELDGKRYHRDCIKCVDCGVSLADSKYSLEPRGIVCESCWASSSGMLCAGCNQLILPDGNGQAPYYSLAERNYHAACVKCATCGVAFGENVSGPYVLNGELYCKTHATEVKRGLNSGGSQRPSMDRGIKDEDEQRKINSILSASKTGWR
ncbi:uncharacterized protein MONBRDRAFT_38749 [Monosiga brevicollis MX1]|uniref:PDZ and LIM domain protein Zasp n=1 Tax=Monosiga brevicollis TaxID=81824 RepID=A9V9W5_MONBE|nr:uncharacterized protein MONBRDRAFT_38749 [Monosiga brevicollis MX1]EDQ85626.1 predicted protein [Monosiga brevicollis MX1]|eukprot:XP_001749575.1 hypothetical protein [Monosiga brevicollis MX1]